MGAWDIAGLVLLLGFVAALLFALTVLLRAVVARRRRPGASLLERAIDPHAEPSEVEATRPPGPVRRRWRRWRSARRRRAGAAGRRG